MLYKFLDNIIKLPKFIKVFLQFLFDFTATFCSLYVFIILDVSIYFLKDVFIIAALSLFLSFMFLMFGIYSSFVRFVSSTSLLKTLLITIILYSFIFLIEVNTSVNLYNWISSLFLTFSILILPRLILHHLSRTIKLGDSLKIAIVGNNYESYQLYESLKLSPKYSPVCFLVFSSNSIISKSSIFPEFHSSKFLKQASKLGIDIILSPASALKEPWFTPLIESVQSLNIPFFKSNGLESLINKNDNFTISPLSLTDLTDRSPQPPIKKLLEKNTTNKTVMITGGGGSIGSEICKQVLLQAPKKIIIIESSEYNLYEIELLLLNLTSKYDCAVKIIAVLCSVLDKSALKKIFQDHQVDTVFHAAAYKHVSIVENNPLISFENNVFGTKNIAELSLKYKVSSFTLISTDKAVNPTNIMGVTKRLAEIFCQSLAEISNHTTFTIVRFGNVLGSSGSVVPKFEKQIEAGGPITVTHLDVNRFFMSIVEAAQLVIQASAMTKKCKVFILDMGKPVNILELAKRLCSIRGLSSYCIEEGTHSGDIEIKITGLKKGEKLFEEMLATKHTINTDHPRILSAKEDFIFFDELSFILDEIKTSLECSDGAKLKEIFSKLKCVNYSKKNMLEFCSGLKQK